MTGAELLLRFVPGPLINLWRLINQRPRPDIRIVELRATGGSHDKVDFSAYVGNYGTQQCRAEFTAYVGDSEVECAPRVLDLIPNTPPQRVGISVPRPALGNLVHALNHATTLYGETLRFEAVSGKHRRTEEWREELYNPETDAARHEIQQREWRFARGDDTDSDRRADFFIRINAEE